MSDVMQRLTPALADRYEVLGEVGHGGMATVYRARDLRHERLVAIKVLHPDLAAAVGAERFLREISIAARLQHPNILTLIDSGEANGLLYYVMPFVSGQSLRDMLAQGKAPLPVSESLRLVREVVDALAYAHRQGVVHRDVKPDNVMVAERHALVVDFGVAKAMSNANATHALTSIGISLGTPAYMAPEQAAADPGADHRVDIYAVGVLAYELLGGRPPFTGTPQAVLAAQISTAPPPITTLRPDVPPAVAAVVMKCLEKDASDRYQSADELQGALDALITPMTGSQPVLQALASNPARRRRLGAFAIVALMLIVAVAWTTSARSRRQRWVSRVAVPELKHLADIAAGADIRLVDSAYRLGRRAMEVAPRDSALRAALAPLTTPVVIRTSPPGASVYRSRYDDSTGWTLIARTPSDTVLVPIGISRYRIEMPGRRTVHLAVVPGLLAARSWPLDSLAASERPDGDMVFVPGSREAPASMIGLDYQKAVALADFRIDRHEVTNAQYKSFVDAGGYAKREYWDQPFVRDGKRLTWEGAMPAFVDRIGRPGPATWEGGAPPSGQEDFPVGGISWYEASAYAKFAGKMLPTVFHWARAAQIGAAQFVVPGSNFGSTAPRKGGTFAGMSPYGAFDMAGNVREWCFNGDGDRRYILGGGFSDEDYLFTDAYAQSPFDRSAMNGVRLVKVPADSVPLEPAKRVLAMHDRDYSKEKPAPDILFQSFRRMYDYDPTPIAARTESRDTSSADWTTERVSYGAAYGKERIPAFLFLPKRHPPPYQVVLYFPGSGAIQTASSSAINGRQFDYLLRSGRAVIFPVYKSTFERRDSLQSDYADESVFYRDHVVMWGKDVRRSIDYLGTRADIDTSKVAYFGLSWGAALGGIFPAIEPRIKTVILYVAGLERDPAKPEADPLNFLPHVRQPTLMLNGKYDHFFPVESAQKPFFRFLGTPAEQKRYVVYEGGHNVPRERLIAESLDWLDKYLGRPR